MRLSRGALERLALHAMLTSRPAIKPQTHHKHDARGASIIWPSLIHTPQCTSQPLKDHSQQHHPHHPHHSWLCSSPVLAGIPMQQLSQPLSPPHPHNHCVNTPPPSHLSATMCSSAVCFIASSSTCTGATAPMRCARDTTCSTTHRILRHGKLLDVLL
jgi:hypothetical protein